MVYGVMSGYPKPLKNVGELAGGLDPPREGTLLGYSFEDDMTFHDSAAYGLLETDL